MSVVLQDDAVRRAPSCCCRSPSCDGTDRPDQACGQTTRGYGQVLSHSKICKGCWQQMHLPVPLRGVFSVPFRIFGIRPSKMNPNTCTICELMFSRVMQARKISIDATVLFADLRGYTGLSQSLPPDVMSGLLDAFYDECANAIWEQDGLLNKTIGDAVMAIFNFPIKHDDHASRAQLAASRSEGMDAKMPDLHI